MRVGVAARAARGGVKSNGHIYSGGDDPNLVAWFIGNIDGAFGSKPVGMKLPNELGIFDMSGNVWEFVWDPASPAESYLIPRGGMWNTNASGLALASRIINNPAYNEIDNWGFRLARNTSPVADPDPSPTPTPAPPSEPPDFSGLAGTYIGNFGAAGLEVPSEALLRNGQVLITLGSNRQFTGALVFNGRKAGFRGRFDADGNWSGVATVAGRLVEMELFLEAGELGNRVSCMVVFNGEESTAFVLLPAAHTGAKGDVFGWNGSKLNVLFQSTGMSGKKFGYGFAAAASAKDGVMRFAGRLADDMTWSGAARVVRDEAGALRLPLAVSLNSTKGLLHGEGTLDSAADVQSGDAEFYSVGAWTWVRGANARARAHKTGFVEGLQPFGQRWNYQRGKNLWTGAVNQLPVRMNWDAGLAVLPAARTFSTMWPLNNRPVWSPVPPRGFQMTVLAPRGEFSGKIPNGSAVLPFRGLFLAPGVASDGGKILGGGFIAGQESSGELELLDVPQ